MDRDKGGFVFGSQKSSKGKEIMEKHGIEDEETIVLLAGDKVYKKSEAVIRIFEDLPSPWRRIGYLKYVPEFVRDALYRLFARYRYRLFGTTSKCVIDYNQDRMLE